MIIQKKINLTEKRKSPMLSQQSEQEKLHHKRNHITICADEERDCFSTGNDGNAPEDTPTKSDSTDAEVCGLSLLQVKKSINFDLSRENSSDSFIVRDVLQRKDMFFRVENLKLDGECI